MDKVETVAAEIERVLAAMVTQVAADDDQEIGAQVDALHARAHRAIAHAFKSRSLTGRPVRALRTVLEDVRSFAEAMGIEP